MSSIRCDNLPNFGNFAPQIDQTDPSPVSRHDPSQSKNPSMPSLTAPEKSKRIHRLSQKDKRSSPHTSPSTVSSLAATTTTSGPTKTKTTLGNSSSDVGIGNETSVTAIAHTVAVSNLTLHDDSKFSKDVAPPVTFSSTLPPSWPAEILFLNHPIVSPFLTQRQQVWLKRKPPSTYPYSDTTNKVSSLGKDVASQSRSQSQIDPFDAVPIIKLPIIDVQDQVEIRVIQDPDHPAFGQRGLFAVRDLKPGEFVLPYFGYVHSSTASEQQERERQKTTKNESTNVESVQSRGDKLDCTSTTHSQYDGNDSNSSQELGSWDTSDYDLNLYRDEDIELAIDAAQMGNQARFCNDYRGVSASKDLHNTISDIESCDQKDWDRKAKRAAKTQTKNVDSIDKHGQDEYDHSWTDFNASMAIPNVEFRDVWFEWTIEDNAQTNHKIEGNEDVDAGLQINIKPAIVEESQTRLQVIDSKRRSDLRMQDESKSVFEPDHAVWKRKRRKVKTGIRGVAIFVLPAGRSGKRKQGIKAGQELLVSYGKGFWAHHSV